MASDYQHLAQTLRLAQSAHERHNVPVGAILVGEKQEIVATSVNSIHSENSLVAHAELRLLLENRHYLHDHQWQTTLYVSYEPCMMCMSMAIMSHIKRVVWAANDYWAGGSHLLDLHAPYITMYHIELVSCPYADLQRESVQMVQEYLVRLNSSRIPLVLGTQVQLLDD